MYCGRSQKMLMGTGTPGWSSRPCCSITRNRFISTRAATPMVKVVRARPVPIRCNMEIPRSFPVSLRIQGTKYRSYSGMDATAVNELKTVRDAGGILKWGPTDVSMLMPWRMKKEDSCVMCTVNINEKIQIGSTRTSSFTSSTCVTGRMRHGFGLQAVLVSMSMVSAELCVDFDITSLFITAALSRSL